MSESIRNLFTEISPTYDRLNHLLSFNIDKRWRRKTIEEIRNRKTPLKALDLCAGTLDLSREFLRQFPTSNVQAVDFSQGMLDQGMKKLSPEEREKIQTICADALSLPFPDGTFDVVFCGYGFRNLDNQETALHEIRRVLKPGGQLLILEFFKPTNWFTKLFHSTYGHFMLPTVGGLISRQSHAYRYLHESISRFYTLNECKIMFNNHMFKSLNHKNFFNGVSSLISAIKDSEGSLGGGGGGPPRRARMSTVGETADRPQRA